MGRAAAWVRLRVQIAKSYGADVTGVDGTRKLDMMRSIGADHVIDYTQEDFTKNGKQYDFILDVAAHHSAIAYKRALSPEGVYRIVGGSMGSLLRVALLGPLISRNGSRQVGILIAYPDTSDLTLMTELIEAGKVTPVIDRRYKLDEVPHALRYLEQGHAQGKVVITMGEAAN